MDETTAARRYGSNLAMELTGPFELQAFCSRDRNWKHRYSKTGHILSAGHHALGGHHQRPPPKRRPDGDYRFRRGGRRTARYGRTCEINRIYGKHRDRTAHHGAGIANDEETLPGAW